LIRHPESYTNGPLLASDLPNIQQEDIVWKQFGYSMQEGLVIFKQTKGGVHKFLFNTKKHSSFSIRHFYIKNLSLLDTFCVHFLEELQPYLHIMDNYTISIAQLIGSNFHTIDCVQEKSTHFENKEIFLKKIGALPRDFTLTKPFSNQEKRCLNLLYQGKSLKETAKEMDLSYRTAEHYLENIKNKANCQTKSEVLELLRYLKMLELF
jgi:DNA-binding CsgD family transcriptional regulator